MRNAQYNNGMVTTTKNLQTPESDTCLLQNTAAYIWNLIKLGTWLPQNIQPSNALISL